MILQILKRACVLGCLCLLPVSISIAVEPETTAPPVETPDLTGPEEPVEIRIPDEDDLSDEVDPVLEAADAADEIGETYNTHPALLLADPCTIREQGEYLGSEVCDDCHQDKIDTVLRHPHGRVSDLRSPFGQDQCETCHGPGEVHFVTEGDCIISMYGRLGESPEQRNEVCLRCHKGGMQMHWYASVHEAEGLACANCHAVHEPENVTRRDSQADVCYQCHKDIRAQTYRASSHPIKENKVICSDCHNAHGGAGPASLKQATINENCYNCHAEKRGPFLWEHYPASEDCTLCHRVHGSNHRALLNKPGPQLCQQCHAVNFSGGGRTHINNFLDFNDADQARARSVIGLNCANCHSKVHGSNHPSGSALSR